MGFLSSLFQSGAPQQQVQGAPVAVSKLPEELAPYYKDILGKAQALYNEKTSEGFKPYTGPTMADFTPEQQQAFTGIAGIQGQQAPIFDEAMQMTRTAATPMTQEQLTSYMSPYQQAVTDIEKREATKQYESQVQPQLAAQAAMTQPFGGSRQAILEGMAADTQQRLLGDIQAKGSAQGYADAVKRFQVDRQAQGQAGAQLATMAPNQFKAQLGELGAMQTVGEQKQQQSQTALDEAFRQYQLEQNYPYDTMSKYQSVVTGAPVQTTQFAQPSPPAPSTAQTLLGGLGTLVGTYGAFGGKLPNVFGKEEGGVVYAEGGGGLNNLPVIKAQDGIYINKYRDSERKYMHPYQGSANAFYFDDAEEQEYIARQIKKNKEEERIRQLEIDAANEPYSVGPDGNVVPPGGRTNLQGYGDKPNMPIVWGGEDTDPYESVAETERKQLELEVAPPILEMDNPYATSYDPSGLTTLVKNPLGPGMKEIPSGEVTDLDINKALSPTYENPQGPETITQYNARREQDLKIQIPMNTLQDSEMNAMRSTQAIKNIDRRALTELRSKEETDIAAAEKLYLDASAKQKGKLDERAAGLTDQKNREQWANVASFFARLGSASPRKGGIMGVLDVALQEAPETIEKMGNTNKAIKARREEIEDKQIDLETILRKEELGMKLSGAERREKRRVQDKIEENTDKLYDLEVEKLQAEIDANLAIDPIKITDLNGLTKLLNEATGVKISNDGSIIGGVPLKGEARAELNIIIQRARATATTYGLEYYEKHEAENFIKQVNHLITRKKVLKPGDEGYVLKPGDEGYVEPTLVEE
jgi:hypothetical protein